MNYKYFVSLLVLLLATACVEGGSASTVLDASTSYYEDDEYKFYLLKLYSCFILLLLVLSSNRGDLDQVKEVSSMNQRILRAVYSQAKLKAEVERQLGQELGNVPPVADLTAFGAHAEAEKAQHGRRVAMHLGSYFLALFLGVYGANHRSISLGAYACYLMLGLAFQWGAIHFGGLRKPPVRSCKCCACGKVASTECSADVLETALLDCENCNGTGICSPACPGCDEPKSFVNAMVKVPAASFMCTYVFGACGAFCCRRFRKQQETTGKACH